MDADKLKKVLAEHKRWLETDGEEGKYATLRGATLRHATLRHATLRYADLQGADLRGANLRSADLRSADLDYSFLPLWCGSLSVKIDKRLAAQLLYHALRAIQSCADEPDVAAVLSSEACLRLANQFHRVEECGRIEPPTAQGADAGKEAQG